MARLEMNISAADYQDKIDRLTEQVNKLSDLIASYRQKEQQLTSFVGEQDSNFERLRENVRTNIEAAQRSYTIAVNAREALQKAMTEMSGTASKIAQNIDNSKEKLSSTIASKLPVGQLLDG